MEGTPKPIASWADLEAVDIAGTKEVVCPATSEVAGRAIIVRIRAIRPLELVRVLNFPMDEINAMVQRSANADEFETALKEHQSLMTAEQLEAVVIETVRAGLVEPDPATGDARRLSRDFAVLFREIMALTIPPGAVDTASRFRGDGERGSD